MTYVLKAEAEMKADGKLRSVKPQDGFMQDGSVPCFSLGLALR